MIDMPIRVYLPTDRVVEGTLRITDSHVVTVEFLESMPGALRLADLISSGKLVGIMFSYLIAVPKE
jgi:hypothetical protein